MIVNSCFTCKHFEPSGQSEDYGYCMYPVPAWLIIAIGSPGRDMSLMPGRYSPCMTYEEDDAAPDK